MDLIANVEMGPSLIFAAPVMLNLGIGSKNPLLLFHPGMDS